jgi:hypothetical protein
MARIVQIEKADPTYKGHQIEDIEIKIHKSIFFDQMADPTEIFKADAEELFKALRHALPGGTFDRLLVLMLQDTATQFIISHERTEREIKKEKEGQDG